MAMDPPEPLDGPLGQASGVAAARRQGFASATIAALRPHQWTKNALVLLPMLLAPGAPERATIVRGALAFVTFSFCASAGYVLNDILDIEADRAHPTKRHRPFASGALPKAMGAPLVLGLLVASFAIAMKALPLPFTVMLALYFAGTVWYSFSLKRLLLVDVLVLAGLYTHRILAGGIATGVQVSSWLLGFSMFFFTSLAFTKRYVELQGMTGSEQIKNRGYMRTDIDMITSMGTASGYIAALVFMLYVESAAVRVNYREPSILWLILPILLYWLGRIWLLAGRGQMQDDPVRFAIKDSRSVVCAILVALIAALARYTPSWLSGALH